MAGLKWFVRRLQYKALTTVVPSDVYWFTSGSWLSQNSISVTFPRNVCVQNYLGFCELEGTILCLPSSFEVAISGHRFHLWSLCTSGSQHLLFCIVTKLLAGIHMSFLHFRSHLSMHYPCKHFVELQNVMGDTVTWNMMDVQHGGHFAHLNVTVFIL
jgi:hypothetical protein